MNYNALLKEIRKAKEIFEQSEKACKRSAEIQDYDDIASIQREKAHAYEVAKITMMNILKKAGL